MPCVGDTPHEMGRFYRSDSSERLLERRKNSGSSRYFFRSLPKSPVRREDRRHVGRFVRHHIAVDRDEERPLFCGGAGRDG